MFSEELLAKARNCKSNQEFLELAKANGIELSEEEARDAFEKLNAAEGVLTDEGLDHVAGGTGNVKEVHRGLFIEW